MVRISSPDKVLFPASGITKAELVGYYDRVAPAMLPALLGRPLTLHRFPRGIGAKGFMQKNAADHFPETIQRHQTRKNDGGFTTYPIISSADDISWLANQNTITFHIWTSRVPTTDRPDWMVLDLDPPEMPGAPGPLAAMLRDVRTVAVAARDVLASFGLSAALVATGSKGFHLWVRLDGALGFDQISLANRALAGLVAADVPEQATTEFLKKERGGRVFVDWLRARPGATVVAPLSVRARPGAPVAVPIQWDEINDAQPDGWTIADVEEIVGRTTPQQADLQPQSLPIDDIVAAARGSGVDLDTPFDRFGRR